MLAITRRSTLVLAVSAFAAITASSAFATEAKTVKIALDWTPNTNHIGLYVAQAKGYFKDSGLDVTILPYTDAPAGTLVSNQVADFGIDDIGAYSQRAAGADVKSVYAIVQAETGRLIVSADRTDIKSPKDLDLPLRISSRMD
ncbi:ABC transporter substrate-binding protein [Agrobacterium rhizogenes]|nr:ABC transporter substrate-binding protein [Rhizobium rhizogenes]